jgi:hypothetical protein
MKNKSSSPDAGSASQLIDARIRELGDWRGEMLSRLRALIKQADPKVVEEVKWIKADKPLGTAVWTHNGPVLLVNAFKNKVNLTFFEGARLTDSKKLFNTRLEGNKWRGIDFNEGDKINEPALKNLIREAVAYNTSKSKK